MHQIKEYNIPFVPERHEIVLSETMDHEKHTHVDFIKIFTINFLKIYIIFHTLY